MSKTHLSNSVRIIGGSLKGRKISFPNIDGLRPSTDRVRETVFNWLMPYIHISRCLDLFAGSGALGFEAISRGAKEVIFIDSNTQVISFIQKYIQQFKLDNSHVLNLHIPQAIFQAEPFDIIFLDPPFQSGLLEKSIIWLAQQNLFHQDTLFYIECSKKYSLNQVHFEFDVLKEKIAGDVKFLLCKIKEL